MLTLGFMGCLVLEIAKMLDFKILCGVNVV